MPKKFGFILLLAIIFLTGGFFAFKIPQTKAVIMISDSELFGEVLDAQTKQALLNVELRLVDNIFNDSWQTVTDNNGNYKFVLADAGGSDSSFNLTASLDGYQTKIISDINIPFWSTIELNIELEPEGELDPVIIAPGIMGSWEKYGEWVIDPIFHTYDSLIEAMIESGYELNETLFLFPYDWRANNVITAGLLKQKINEIKQRTSSSKVDIVAHSMGGLVSRYYAQSNEYNNDVDQLIFLGAPHHGSPESYLAYEGAYFTGNVFISKIKKFYFQIEAIKHGYFSLPQYIREQVASVEQLLPIYNYLQDKVNNSWQYRLYPAQYPRNTFLENLNVDPAIEILKQRVDITNIYSSAGATSTLSAIKVVPDSNIYDNKWMDGYPENLDNNLNCLVGGDGDGTVPIESLNLLQGVAIIEMADTDHREIATQAQKDVIEVLTGERPENYYTAPWSAAKRILFIRVYSPVDFIVIAPDGKMIGKDFSADTEINQIAGAFYSGFESDAEFVTIINPVEGDYQVKLQGADDGAYQLGINILEENGLAEQAENLISGIISAGAEEAFNFNYQEENEIPEIVIQKEIDFNDLIKDLDELYNSNEIKKKFVYKALKAKFKHLNKIYNKIESKKYKKGDELIKQSIKLSLKIANKQLSFYLNKEWITQMAYDILKYDIMNLINKLN